MIAVSAIHCDPVSLRFPFFSSTDKTIEMIPGEMINAGKPVVHRRKSTLMLVSIIHYLFLFPGCVFVREELHLAAHVERHNIISLALFTLEIYCSYPEVKPIKSSVRRSFFIRFRGNIICSFYRTIFLLLGGRTHRNEAKIAKLCKMFNVRVPSSY